MRNIKLLNKINEMFKVLPLNNPKTNTETIEVENEFVKYTYDLDFMRLDFEDKINSDKNETLIITQSFNEKDMVDKFFEINKISKAAIKVNGVSLNKN
ncbi:hypothetical protein [Aliarcobacter butzleri]|uniref:hypothetical protein n=1 Tax=Aliarcobacter butzleri TaxID=28197 RepID=UPI0021B22EAF|nr:hypothetical protein [Aliarcobacter butzleri]MCT7632139.1 hypothetical protein [Aliarcobacter butzleri]